MYADDMAILGESPDDLQRNLDVLSEYCKVLSIEFNTEETKIIIFKRLVGQDETDNGTTMVLIWKICQILIT
jgi:hypothetical protein